MSVKRTVKMVGLGERWTNRKEEFVIQDMLVRWH